MLRVNEKLLLALPKGRILADVMPVVRAVGIEPEPAFDEPDDRRLRFATNLPELDIIRVRSFDVATFVAFGAAHLGVAGNDVLMEFDYPEIYAPVDLGVGRCRLVVAEPKDMVGEANPTTAGFASPPICPNSTSSGSAASTSPPSSPLAPRTWAWPATTC